VASELESGGTWAGATEALKGNLCPVLVRPQGGRGAPALIKQGGVAISSASELGGLMKSATRIQESLL